MELAPVAAWWVASVGLAAAGLPIAARVLRPLPDRGAGLAIPAALVVLVLPTYWVGQVRYGPVAIGLGVAALAVATAAAYRTVEDVPWGRGAEAVVVFTLAFALLLVVRAADPSIYPAGGEKFLDYGLLNAVLRADRLPPEDIWFAGAPVQYYYGGQLVAGILTTLTGVAPRYAYNLALAGVYGTLVAAAYGLAGAIVAARGGPYRLAGAVGAVFVGVASNLVPAVQAVLWVLPSRVASGLADVVAARTALAAGDLAPMSSALDFLYYWTPSRVIRGTINEFPLFAFINGDLHAHMSSTPFLVLVAGVAFAYTRTPAENRRGRRALVFLAVPPVAGFLAVVNTWSFPSAVGVTWLALVFAPADPAGLLPHRVRSLAGRPGNPEVTRLVAASAAAVIVAALGVLWVAPFFLGPAGGRAIGALPDRSGLLEFLLVHGAFLAVFAAFLGLRAGRTLPGPWPRRLLLVGLGVVIGVAADAAAVAVLVPLGLVAWVLLRHDDAVGYETVLFIAGAGLAVIVEFLYVVEQAGPGRFNTVFKTYMQVWVLWGVGAAAALTRLWSENLGTTPARRRRIAAVATAGLLVAVSIYAPLAIGVRTGDAPADTLDATLDARQSHSAEWEGIQYLDRQPGTPVLLTAPGCWCNEPPGTQPYAWVNAPSTFTGIPTVAGWSHEIGYRSEAAYNARVADVRTMYTGAWPDRVRLLRRYDVRYVWVGPTERTLYGQITGFDGRDGVTVAFENDRVTIYRIDTAGLDTA